MAVFRIWPEAGGPVHATKVVVTACRHSEEQSSDGAVDASSVGVTLALTLAM